MIVQAVRLADFRNYENCEVAFSDNMNVFVGKNAQGKTNLLESIVFISTSRSHRNIEDQNMIREGADMARVMLRMKEEGVTTDLSGVISKEGKRLFIQKQPVKKVSEFVGRLNAILFSPTDFDLFEGSPKIRRRFMDMEIGKEVNGYVTLMNSYQKLLKERNLLLKEENVDRTYLEVLTDQLIRVSMKISAERRKFIRIINGYLQHNYETISEEQLPLELHYFSMIEENDDEKKVRMKYDKCLERDIFLKQTSIGIHKDDFSFWMKGRNANEIASQGQKRMILLSCKAALIGYIRMISHREAVLLLDDVLSELDEVRQRNLLHLIPEGIQTIITTTNIEEIRSILPAKSRIFEIGEGKIASVKEV